ncbi:NAD(P)/FAD-dependent oxidoreductase [Rhodobaculum claviforme]|uniref:FAD-dependent oxidoreductase n=1 Tax=Rhodobaculum claviforme TaxID=1549854 RepID=A0A934WIX8_9RHOB|nr:FAD-dependent oxidoreductase [Rhodobaculum claviforme]MBK5927436.1 FAD-dependent oxidoreductase [Rhodobaculum claviforme]
MVRGFDCVVIGAGIAGASVGAELAESGLHVGVLEAEAQPGHHATGRSAALYTTTYGPPVIRALSRASGPALRADHPGLSHPLLRPRGALFVAPPGCEDTAARLAGELGPAVHRLTPAQARARMPLLRTDAVAAALLEPDAADIEVASLHALFLRRLTAAGGVLLTRAPVRAITRDGAGWRLDSPAGTFRTDLLVNAAGAWADAVADLAAVRPLGLQPRRRTAVVVDVPAGVDLRDSPMTIDINERWYVKPDAGRLLLSPADASPSPPCDAAPEEIDVAIAIDRVQGAMDLPVRRIVHKWAGLRSFLPDGDPVAGMDPAAAGFFWLAGQGGYGIQTAPALARTAAALATGRALPGDIADQGVSAAALSPARLGARAR